ncbi:RNA-binding S4 domain-containing protein [Cryobacterium tagatosivorans]|uniref:RNA-binding S4 domain-containing protein n=1 Tax=Cryobacterium tagatosivorans TaxID=1259199 RepID=A0A4R8UEL9_9MICO|nr:RNA-binding S4 domain-containing protein [Cryobacterium tagatosivorans]TFB52046.1 RNA-binding S4 domain-containing protein [Cryobacterium tagatosivorans]
MDPVTTARVDSWTWAVRMFRTRSQATAACRAGHVRVNGDKVKSAQAVRVGDEVRVRSAGFDRVLVVARIVSKRVGAPVAAECYVDKTPPPPPREEVALVPMRDRGAGRPTKRERRDIDKLRGASRTDLPDDD